MKSFNNLEKLDGILTEAFEIRNYISSWLQSSHGVSPEHNSKAKTPNDHISVLLS